MMHGEAVLGVDGCPGGWVGALVVRRAVTWLFLEDMTAVLDAGAGAVGIDIPIGLSDGPPRECDLAARRWLGRPRSAAVFPAPVRPVLRAADYRQACDLAFAASGRRMSKQAFHIVGKVREVDDALRPADQDRVVEVHPEVSFRLMAGRDLGPKKRAANRAARLDVLSRWVDADLARRPRQARPDDALDALACAWTAARWAAGTAQVLPSADPPRDARGLRMQIVA